MRTSFKALLTLAVLLLTLARYSVLPATSPYVPPPSPPDLPDFPDLPDLPDANDPWDIPFDPSDLPDPVDFPLPPEDPWDDPFDDLPLPDPPLDIEDPFPDFPSFSTGEELGYAAFSDSGSRGAANQVTRMMQFPARIPFHPGLVVRNPRTSPRPCEASLSNRFVIAEGPKNRVSFLETCPWQVTGRLTVGEYPIAAASVPDSSVGLVANAGNGIQSGTISVIDLSLRSVTRTVTLPSRAANGDIVVPNVIAVHPDGSKAYISSHGCEPGSYVFILDLTTYTIAGNIPVGCYPSAMALSPDGSQLWVSQRGDDRVDVFDTATNERITSLGVLAPTGIAITPTGTKAYLAEASGAGDLWVVDTSTFQVNKRIPVGVLPHVVAITPGGSTVYVTNGLSNSISQISTVSDVVVRTIKLRAGYKHPLGLYFSH